VTFRNLGVVLSKIVSLVLSPDGDVDFELVVETDVQCRETDSAGTKTLLLGLRSTACEGSGLKGVFLV
jgi:hypothetical protein